MSWHGFTDFKQECVTSWTYVSLGGSNGCADQLTNLDGTQKVELGNIPQKKEKGLGR